MVTRPSGKEWITALGCDIFGGGIGALGWKAGDMDLTWDRTISEVNGNQITLDAPLTVALDTQYGASSLILYQWNGRIQECGIENMTLVSDYDRRYSKDEDHCWTGISIGEAENCWVRQVSFRHFSNFVAEFLTWEGLCQPHQPHAFPSINEYGKHRNWTFVNDRRNDHCFCYPDDRYLSWEGPDRTGKQICARRDYR